MINNHKMKCFRKGTDFIPCKVFTNSLRNYLKLFIDKVAQSPKENSERDSFNKFILLTQEWNKTVDDEDDDDRNRSEYTTLYSTYSKVHKSNISVTAAVEEKARQGTNIYLYNEHWQ